MTSGFWSKKHLGQCGIRHFDPTNQVARLTFASPILLTNDESTKLAQKYLALCPSVRATGMSAWADF